MSNSQWWRDDKRWRSQRLSSGARSNAVFLFVLGAIVLALAAPATSAIPTELAKGKYAILSVLIFDAIGLAFLGGAVREAMAWRKFGEVFVVLDPWPGQLGGHVAGYFELTQPLPASHLIMVQLSCIQQFEGRRNVNKRVVWTEEVNLMPVSPSIRQIWFCFKPQKDLPASELPAKRFHYWELNLRVNQPGPDINRTYTIPVFPGEESNQIAERKTRVDPNPAEQRLLKLMQLEKAVNEVRLAYKSGHGNGPGLALLIFGLVSLASAAFVSQQGAFGLLMGGVFTIVALPMSLGGLWFLGRRLRVCFQPGLVSVRVFWFYIPIYTRQIASGNNSRWNFVKSSFSRGQPNRVFYDLQLQASDGQSCLTIGSNFSSEKEARQAACVLASAAGLPQPGEN